MLRRVTVVVSLLSTSTRAFSTRVATPRSVAGTRMYGSSMSAARDETFDLLVIGSGSGGIGAAQTAARFGKKVAMIEKERFGGDCTWTGCVPSKALLAAAKAAHTARTASKFGVSTGEVKVDFAAVKAYLQGVQERIYESEDSPAVFEKKGVRAIEGAARFVDRTTLAITPSDGSEPYQLRATNGILIGTGARPRVPKIAGLDTVPYRTYLDIFTLDELPERLTVVGGGHEHRQTS